MSDDVRDQVMDQVMDQVSDPIDRPMVRTTDPATSRDAATRLRRTGVLSRTQALVWEAIHAAGAAGLTDYELAALPQFGQFRESTARKRRCELAAAGYVGPAGVRDRQTVWVAVARQTMTGRVA